MVLPSWTGWSRSRSAGSRSPPRRPHASGTVTGSTSSTPPATSTSPSRSSARCASSTARSRSSTRSPGSSPSRRPSGARPTSTRSPGSPSSTRWTGSAPTSRCRSGRSASASAPTRSRSSSRSAPRTSSRASSTWSRTRPCVWQDDLGTEFEVTDVPAEMEDAVAEARATLIEACADVDDELMEMYLEEKEIPEGSDLRGAPQGDARADDDPGPLRLGLQEQGRPAAARRDRRAAAVAAAGRPRIGRRAGQGRPRGQPARPGRPTTTPRSRRSPSRS